MILFHINKEHTEKLDSNLSIKFIDKFQLHDLDQHETRSYITEQEQTIHVSSQF